ncbi:MAG: NAD(P)/FAD-dependent oxidoreductase [Clostridia bacterium]
MQTIIIGGGASGMLAGVFSAQYGKTLLLEQNEKLGKKLYITGKGRCNLTNCTIFSDFFNNVISNPKFLYSSIKNWDYQKTIDFFEENGVPTKIERGNRVFPCSDKSNDVIKALTRALQNANVDIHLNEKVIDIVTNKNIITKVITNKAEYKCDKVILATGGISYSSTGSTGDGYKFAKKMGHSIITPAPGLVAIVLDEVYDYLNNPYKLELMPILQGLSLKNIKLTAINKLNQKVIFEDFGELVFTSNGISGPIILSLSSHINRLNLSQITIKLDLKPALDNEKLENRILREITVNNNKSYKNYLQTFLPSSMVPFVNKLSKISPDTKVCTITKEERDRIIYLLKNLNFSIKKLDDIDYAIITSGGVSTKEINPKTMQSKIIDNLYFAGELIDVDALTGGYNLQIAFATAFASANT